MPRFLQYVCGGVIVAVLVGVPFAYCLWRKQFENSGYPVAGTEKSSGTAARVVANLPKYTDLSIEPSLPFVGRLIPVDVPGSNDELLVKSTNSNPAGQGFLRNEFKPRKLTLNAAIAAAIASRTSAGADVVSFVKCRFLGELVSPVNVNDEIEAPDNGYESTILNAEIAYWKLYETYGRLHAAEEMIRVLAKCRKVLEDLEDTGLAASTDLKDAASLEAKYHELRNDRFLAAGEVLDAERNLRGLMGIPNDDGTRLVPITPPSVDYYQPKYDEAYQNALAHNPRLVQAQERVRRAKSADGRVRPKMRGFILDEELYVLWILDQQYQKLAESYQRLEAATEESKAYIAGIDAYCNEFRHGHGKGGPSSPPQVILILCGQLGPALVQRNEAISMYNQTRARFEYECGSIVSYRLAAVLQSFAPTAISDLILCAEIADGEECPFTRDFFDAAEQIRKPTK